MTFTWNVDPIIFSIQTFSLHWYGIFFSVGFLIGLFYVNNVFKKEKLNTKDLDTLLIYCFIGTIVGARLGHCFFYQPSYYLSNPIQILMIWKGGLASHGGGIGLTLSVWLFCLFYKYNFVKLADLLCIPTACTGGFIRLGNLFNSEIYGKATNSDYGVIFSRIDLIPRHPVQLYEAIAYFSIMFILIYIYKKFNKKYIGLTLGMFLVLVFSIRFILEFFKPEQADYISNTELLTVGQYLSIPFVCIGIILFVYSIVRNIKTKEKI
jgi:phosphatidylglycerol---prolipoprotein diacylglyceryl transferase